MALINYIEKHLKTFTVKAHKHNYWEIIYVTEGVGTIETENKHTVKYKKGEMICVPPHLTHINNSSMGFKNIHFTIEDWNPSHTRATFNPRIRFFERFLCNFEIDLPIFPSISYGSPNQSCFYLYY